MILDDYVLRDFLVYLTMILASFLMLLQVFTLFELLGDILRNRISPLIVGEYLLNVAPFFLYNVLHLSILLAVLITLGLMQRSNEITAIKATGISIYRVIVPSWWCRPCWRQGCSFSTSSIFLTPTSGRMRCAT